MTGVLPLQGLSSAAKEVQILPYLTNTSLLSIGQLCNDNCIAIFTNTDMLILKQGQVILRGKHNFVDGLWDVPCNCKQQSNKTVTTTIMQKLNILTTRDKTSYKLANFLHACAGSPTIKTFQQAIKNNFFATWPGIHKLDMKYLITDNTNIAMGHLDQDRKNTRSTKVTDAPNVRTFNVLTKLIPFSAKEMLYGDLTGAFPYTSSQGNKYSYVMYNHDSSGILVAPLKNRNATTIVEVWKRLFEKLTKHGHKTKVFIIR